MMGKIQYSCDLSGTATPLPHIWEHTVGSDHAPMALRADFQAQLRRCHGELKYLNSKKVEQLQAASRTVKEPQSWMYAEREIHLDIELPPHAVAAVTVEFTPAQTGGGTEPGMSRR